MPPVQTSGTRTGTRVGRIAASTLRAAPVVRRVRELHTAAARRSIVPLLVALALAGGWASAEAGSIISAERLIRQCANRERFAAGLPPLYRAPALDAAARGLARDMVVRRFFDHTDPDGAGPQERVDAIEAGWGVGENIAMGYRSVRAACRGWMASPGHRKNILEPSYEAVGAGYARGRGGPFFVQELAFRVEAVPPEPEEPSYPEDSGTPTGSH